MSRTFQGSYSRTVTKIDAIDEEAEARQFHDGTPLERHAIGGTVLRSKSEIEPDLGVRAFNRHRKRNARVGA